MIKEVPSTEVRRNLMGPPDVRVFQAEPDLEWKQTRYADASHLHVSSRMSVKKLSEILCDPPEQCGFEENPIAAKEHHSADRPVRTFTPALDPYSTAGQALDRELI